MNKYDVTTKYLYEFFTYFGICLFWYKLNAIVEDNTGSTSFLIFGWLTVNLIGLSVSTLAGSYKDRLSVPYDLDWIKSFKLLSTTKVKIHLIYFFKLYIFLKKKNLWFWAIKKLKLSSTSSALLHIPVASGVSKAVKRSHDFAEGNNEKVVKRSHDFAEGNNETLLTGSWNSYNWTTTCWFISK